LKGPCQTILNCLISDEAILVEMYQLKDDQLQSIC